MRKQEKVGSPDVYLMAMVIALVTVGVLLVFDASYAKACQAKWANNDAWFFAKRQLAFAGAGLLLMLAVSRIRLTTFLKMTLPLLAASIVLLFAVLIPGIGHGVNGAYRWIKVGPISIQPSEIAKLALVLYLAGFFARRKAMIRRLGKPWLAPAAVIGIICVLVYKEPDLGTTVTIVATCFAVAFAAGMLKRHLLSVASVGACFVGFAVLLAPYRLERVRVWLDPWAYRYGDGYQIIHSLIALGTGGLNGVGLCEGREKTYIPAASTDFILSTLGEERGLIGCLVLLAVFVCFIYRGFDVGRRCKSTYANLLAVGITSMVGLQALVNVAVVSSAIPATGVPLPFISYGGSSLVLTLIGVGILLSVSGQVDVPLEERDLYESSLNGWGDGRARLSGHKRGAGASRKHARYRASVRR